MKTPFIQLIPKWIADIFKHDLVSGSFIPPADIRQLRDEVYAVTGIPRPVEFEDKVVGLIEYRDGSIIDVVRKVRE